jgi:hypothetical protein
MKPTPLCSARRADSGGIFGFKMASICERYRDLKFRSNREKVKGQSQLVKDRTANIEDDVRSMS